MAVQAADVEAEVRAAASAYADAFTKGDYAALADQWTESATLAEGARLLDGTDPARVEGGEPHQQLSAHEPRSEPQADETK